MSVETSKTVLKVFGIIDTILGTITLILGVFIALGGGMVITNTADAVGFFFLGIYVAIAGAISLLRGIFCTRASKQANFVMPAFVFAVIGLIGAVVNCLSEILRGLSGTAVIIGTLLGIGLAVLLVLAANTVRKAGKRA